METISNSVMKTKHVIIVEECMKTGGIGASLSAMINESLFDYLDHQASHTPRASMPDCLAALGSLPTGTPGTLIGTLSCLGCCRW